MINIVSLDAEVQDIRSLLQKNPRSGHRRGNRRLKKRRASAAEPIGKIDWKNLPVNEFKIDEQKKNPPYGPENASLDARRKKRVAGESADSHDDNSADKPVEPERTGIGENNSEKIPNTRIVRCMLAPLGTIKAHIFLFLLINFPHTQNKPTFEQPCDLRSYVQLCLR